jgi:hypothetical protein
MANTFEARPMNEVKEELLGRAKGNRNPFLYTIYDEVEPVINGLRSVDREEWARAFSSLAAPHEERAAKAEAASDHATAMSEYLIAYDCYHVARYPAPNSPGKLRAYRNSQVNFHKAAKFFDPPVERVEMPFKGNASEGAVSVGLLRKPKDVTKAPVVVLWGGIDAFKEERPSDPYLAAGMATLAIDMPGVADAPLAGSENGERLWNAVFGYIASRADLDSGRVGIHGGSTGGYWATKVAHNAPGAFARGGQSRRPPRTSPSKKIGLSKRSAVSIRSSWPKRWPAPSAALRAKHGSTTRRSFRSSIRAFSTSRARRCSASMGSTTACFQSLTCICCWNMAVRSRRGSIAAVIWAAAIRSR